MKKIALLLLLFVSTITYNQSSAQSYGTGIGLRLGTYQGITVKSFLGTSTAVEGILSVRGNDFSLTGLFEIQKALPPEGLDWFIGFGGHVGVSSINGETGAYLGVDGIIGLEYTFSAAPINLGLDWKPAINLGSHPGSGFWGGGFALSVRYIF